MATNHAPSPHEMTQVTPQEREDMMLARRMAHMDMHQGGGSNSASASRRDRYDACPSAAEYMHDGSGRHMHDGSGRRYARTEDRRDYGEQRNYSGMPSGGNGNRLGYPPDDPYRGDYRGRSQPADPYRENYRREESLLSGGSGPGGSGMENRLEYARRLQEEAFQRVHASSRPSPPKNTEEADLELAMRMQIEESDPNHRPTINPEQEDEDMKLARFMEESGVSIRDLDEEGLAALKQQALGGGSSLGGTSLGLGGPSPPRQGGGLGLGGGGMLGGLYGGRRDDDSDDDSIELDVLPSARSQLPSSIPPASRPDPSIISPAPPRSADGVPAAIPPPASTASATATTLRQPTAPAPAPRSPFQSGISRTDGLRRQLPAPSNSSGPGTSPSRTGETRRLPAPSRSFGTGRAGMPGRHLPGQTQSAHNLKAMRQGLSGSPTKDRSLSPTPRSKKGPARKKSMDLGAPLMDDLPPGVNLPAANVPGNEPTDSAASTSEAVPAKKEKKKGKLLKRIFGGNKHSEPKHGIDFNKLAGAIPSAIPAPPPGEAGPLPHSIAVNRNIAKNALRSSFTSQEKKSSSICSVCGGRAGKMVAALDKRFHPECFRCMSCNELIDPQSVFAVSIDPIGEQQPLHRKCYAEFYGVQCAVCKRSIPANDDGSVSFIKHPFFNTEQMCPTHANDNKRRCTGCHRFEPDDEPFADLNDGNRCVCYACCRTVIMDNEDVKPLWQEVIRFFEFQLGLPIWEEMRNIPILVVDQAALNETQMNEGTSVHGESSQIMTRGICLSEHQGSMSFRVPSLRFNGSTCSFEACNHSSGFVNLEVGSPRGNAHSEVTAILCLSGLPRDLTASVLAHEATHAWIKLHPDFKVRKMLPAQVEEGCAQLVAYLFLSDGLEPPRRHSGGGPSDEKLRQYFKFSIETDDNEIYGEGYRKAAAAYAAIGIQGLLNHVVHYQCLPPV